MINTMSICPECYRKIPADIVVHDGSAWMHKECPVHGKFVAMVEKDASILNTFYSTATTGQNKSILVPITDSCNMKCPWCYYPMTDKDLQSAKHFDRTLLEMKIQGYNLLLSGGEPTTRPDFFSFTKELREKNWQLFLMTNMITLSDPDFFESVLDAGYCDHSKTLHASLSMQHPKNYSEEIYRKKVGALVNLERNGLKANCIQFSISSLEELQWIRTFYDDTKRLYNHVRIRTMYGNWQNKNAKDKIWLSDLHKEFLSEFGDLIPTAASYPETSNIYSIYMRDKYCGISLSSAPTVENIDLMSCSRPTLQLAKDGKCYSVPVAQIVSEGIDRGWYNGFKIQGV
jgi:MoaA/NifB/PqqE/SkfB family radical SAM enzyme